MAEAPPTGPRRYLYAEFTANDEAAAERVAELLLAFAALVRTEPGNVVFDAFRKTEDPAAFFVYEVYADEAAFQSHLSEERGRVFNSRLAPLVLGGASALTWLEPLRAAS